MGDEDANPKLCHSFCWAKKYENYKYQLDDSSSTDFDSFMTAVWWYLKSGLMTQKYSQIILKKKIEIKALCFP